MTKAEKKEDIAEGSTALELVDTSTGEIIPAELAEMIAASAEDRQHTDAEDLIIPRLKILQDLSPEIKEHKPEYVEGAKQGMIFNTVTQALERSVTFIPAYRVVRLVAWKPRPDSGLLNMDFPEAELEGLQRENPGKWVGKIKHGDGEVFAEVIRTPEWAGICVGSDGRAMPVVISLDGTKNKANRKINTAIELCEVNGVRPASYVHQFTLSTGLEQRGEDEWWGLNVSHNGFCKEVDLVKRAKDLYDKMKSGEAQAAEVSH